MDDAGNLVARRGVGPRRLVVLGHVDTVPETLATVDDGERLHGRGAVDAKGPLCACLAALATCAEEPFGDLTVTVVGAVGEEAPGSVGARHAVATLEQPDMLVIAEPSGVDAITLGYRGQLRLDLTIARPSEHSAGPRPSAADDLIERLGAVRSLAAHERASADAGSGTRREFDRTKITVLDLRVTRSSVEEVAVASVQVRLPVTRSPDRFMAWWMERTSGPGVTTTWYDAVPGVYAAANAPLHRAFRTAIREAGHRPRHTVKTGTSDWNVVADRWNVPTLAYGPGDSALDHTPDEALPWSDYEGAITVWKNVFGHLATIEVAETDVRTCDE